MKTIAILSGDRRQNYAHQFFINNGFSSTLKNNMDFKNTDVLLCGTPFIKNKEYVNCDFHSAFPIETFTGLLKKGQIVFGGNIPESVGVYGRQNDITFVDLLKIPDVVWENAVFTAEALIGQIIIETDFSLTNATVLVLGFGRCGMNVARLLNSFGSRIIIYDHTDNNLSRAKSFGYQGVAYPELSDVLPLCNLIINTVPFKILTPDDYSSIRTDCCLYDIASHPFGFDESLVDKNNLSLHTCPGLPGKYMPKASGELIAKSIISYLERTR